MFLVLLVTLAAEKLKMSTRPVTQLVTLTITIILTLRLLVVIVLIMIKFLRHVTPEKLKINRTSHSPRPIAAIAAANRGARPIYAHPNGAKRLARPVVV